VPAILQRAASHLAVVGLGGLVAILAFANWAALTMEIDTSPVFASPTSQQALVSELGNNSLSESKTVSSDLSQTLLRPIFLASRRPIEPKAVKAPEPPREPQIAVTPPESLKLLGTVLFGPGNGKALIRSSASVQGRWIPVGGSIDGWQIREVTTDNAVIESRGNRVELRILFAAEGEKGASR